MSMPKFSENPPISREDAITEIIASIAMEELALSHIINAEGEKIQYVLGTIPGITGPSASIEDLLLINESVRETLDSIADIQSLLTEKLKYTLEDNKDPEP